MISVPARITSALLSAVFHSRFIKNENMSSNAGAAAKNKGSRYKPPKGYTMTRTPCGECFVESLVPKKIGTDTVIFHIHGGSFKIKLIDAYRRLALKYSVPQVELPFSASITEPCPNISSLRSSTMS